MTKMTTKLKLPCYLLISIAMVSFGPEGQIAHAEDSDDAGLESVEDSMHEFMEYVYQPTYKRLKAAMAAKPTDKSGWKAIKADSLVLAECANLLLIRTPDENSGEWNKAALATRKLGAELYRAAAANEFDAATKAYTSMLTNCNACHKTFADGKYQLKP